MLRLRHRLSWLVPLLVVIVLACGTVWAQTCDSGASIDITTKASLEQAAQQFFAMSARGDYAGLRSQAAPSLASSFNGIEAAITQHQADFKGAQATPSGVFLLDPGSQTLPRAEFFCGIYNSPDRVAFAINNLPPGKYGVVVEDAKGGKTPFTLTLIMQQNGAAWRLAGYYIQPLAVSGHDASWFQAEADRQKKAGQNLPAYLMYYAAWVLSGPVEFQTSAPRDRIASAMDSVRPAAWPMIAVAGKSYHVNDMRPEIIGNDMDLTVRYQAASDIANTAAAFLDNKNVMLGVLQQFPILRDSFGGINARAVDASTGRDYGTLLAMKDVK